MNFASEIKRLRERDGRSVTQLAAAAEINHQTWYNVEANNTAVSLQIAERMLAAMGYKLAIVRNR